MAGRITIRAMKRATATLIISVLCLGLSACKSAYYSAWEKLGWEKRHLLVDEVEEAKDGQEAAKKQVQSTLDRFKAVTNFQGGELESRYKQLSADYERCEARAGDLRTEINEVEGVANDMFKEWETELEQYQSADLRRSSEEKLRQTRQRYGQMLAAMRRSESAMAPVLAKFKDQVLFLKHNLNAAAIASLQNSAATIESDVGNLVAEMNAAIAEADKFIGSIKE